MKKKVFGFLGVLLGAMLLFSGCAQKAEPQTVSVAALAGPTGMGMSQMIADGVDCGNGVNVDFSVHTSADQVVASVINGDYQIAAVPSNMAATMYNKTNGAIILGAVNTLGTLSVISDRAVNIQNIADLEGQTIAATGQGATPEMVLNKLLSENGLEAGKNVAVQWYAEHNEAAAQLTQGNVKAAILPEPFATAALAQNAALVKRIDLSEAWKKATGNQLTMGCVVVNKAWADANPSVVQKFMSAYQKSVETVNLADDKAADYVVKAGIMPKAAVAKKAIPNAAITFIPPKEAKQDLNVYFGILADANIKFIGGKIPDDGFYALEF